MNLPKKQMYCKQDRQKWIGIFQAEWPLQIHAINSAIILAQEGFYVDLFLYKTPIFAELDQVKQFPNINVHIFAPPCHFQQRKIFQILDHSFCRLRTYLFWLKHDKGDLLSCFIPRYIRQEIYEVMDGKYYQCLIGVEKLGLVFAGSFANRIKVPYFYHSLELYTRDNPACTYSLKAKLLKKAEETYHKKSASTIIQDAKRAEVLLKDNGLPEASKVIYLPVSSLGSTYRKESRFLQDKFNLNDDQIVILQFGQLSRFGLELARNAQNFSENLNLVLHDGLATSHWKTTTLIEDIQEVDLKKRVKVSLEKLDSRQIQRLVASSHIGLVLYADADENDRLTVFSSEKLALYLQCGIPVIAFDYPGYEFLEQCQCGKTIKTLQDLHSAIEIILENYEAYSFYACKTFTEHYNFERNFANVIKAIDQLS